MAGYKGVAPVPQATQTRQVFTMADGQTDVVTMGYQPGYVDVYLNGVRLVDGDDYTAADGATVSLTVGAAVDDVLEVVAFTAFEVASMLSFSTTVTGDYTVPAAANPTTVNVNAASATITLPGADVVGRRVTVRKVASGAGTVTINRAGSDVVTRASLTSVTLTSDGDFWTLECVASGRWDLVDGFELILTSVLTGNYNRAIRYTNGYMIQDGRESISGSGNPTSVDIIMAVSFWDYFQNDGYSVVVQNWRSSSGNATIGEVYPLSNNTFTITFSADGPLNAQFMYQATGRWYA